MWLELPFLAKLDIGFNVQKIIQEKSSNISPKITTYRGFSLGNTGLMRSSKKEATVHPILTAEFN